MTKQLYRFQNPNRKLSLLLKQLSQTEIQQTSRQLKSLLDQKKAKIRQKYSLASHQILQSSLIPTKHSYSQFSLISPISANQKFISEKIKANVLTPERFYTSQPNVKAGSFAQPNKMTIQEDTLVISRKFEDYNRIVNEQSGQEKRKRLVSLAMIPHQPRDPPKYKYKRMKQTLFQKFMPDKFNFYAPSMSSGKKSSHFDSSTLKRSQIKTKGLTQQIKKTEQVKKQTLPISSQQLPTAQLGERRSPYQRSRIINSKKSLSLKSKIKIKDINSIQ